jgi:hypothetical protein
MLLNVGWGEIHEHQEPGKNVSTLTLKQKDMDLNGNKR